MSFYSYKNANPSCCPGTVSGNVLDGLNEKICIQVKRVYDSCLQQQQLNLVIKKDSHMFLQVEELHLN